MISLEPGGFNSDSEASEDSSIDMLSFLSVCLVVGGCSVPVIANDLESDSASSSSDGMYRQRSCWSSSFRCRSCWF